MPTKKVDPVAHAERVIAPHILTTDDLIASNRAKLAQAIEYLGDKWLLSPARHVARVAHSNRDGLALFVAGAGSVPFLVIDIVARLA